MICDRATQTGTGTVTADGTVSFKSTGGSINIYSIKVENGSSQGGDDTGGGDAGSGEDNG